jgi:hypothetical protein
MNMPNTLSVQAPDQKFATGYASHRLSPFLSDYKTGNFDLEIYNFLCVK